MNPIRILIVEDDAVLATHLHRMLNQMGYQVTDLAATGEKAVQSALAQLPDVILMDILLRGEITGLQAAEEIHKSADIPVVYLTAYTDDAYLQRAKMTDAYAYLTKPVRDHELRASLEMALYKHQSEKHIQHLNQVLRAVRDINQLITRERDPQRLMDEACNILVRTRGYKLAWIGRIAGDRLQPIASAGEGKDFIETIRATANTAQVEKLPGMESLRTQKPVVCQDISSDERYAPWREEAQRRNLSSRVALPMLNGARAFGALSVYAENPNVFNDDEIDLLLELAQDLAFGLKSIEDELERKQIEAALQKQETLFREVLENSQDIVYRRNLLTDRYEYLSPRFSELFGFAVEKFTDMSLAEVLDFIHPDDRAQAERELAAVSLGKVASCLMEYRFRRQDGSYIWCQDKISIQKDAQGVLLFMVGSLREISVQKQTQEALRESEVRFSGIFNASPMGIILLRLSDNRILSANQAFCKIMGLSLEQVLNYNWGNLDLFPDQRPEKELITEKLRLQGSTGLLEMPYRTSTGEIKDGLISAVLINLEGEDSILIMGQDISERKHLERELQEKTDFLAQVINAMGQGLTVAGTDARFELVNPAYAKMIDYPPEELIGKHPMELTVPDDHAILEQAIASRQRGEASTYENRLMRADGSLVPVLISGVPRIKHGQTVGSIAVITDLSDLKRAEQTLRQNEEKYHSFVSQATEAFTLTDERGVLIEWNPAAEAFTGIPDTEALGSYAWDINLRILPPAMRTPEQFESIHAGLQSLLRDGASPILGKYFDYEVILPDGARHLRQMPFIIKTDQGFRLGSITHDITEETLAEQKLRESEARFSSVFNASPVSITLNRLSDGCCIDANPAFCAELSLTREQVIGRDWQELGLDLDPVDQDRISEMLQLEKETSLLSVRIHLRSGEVRDVLLSAVIINLNGEGFVLVMGRDISELKRAEVQLKAAHAELEQRVEMRTAELKVANQELEKAMRLKDEFLAAISHELRTPLTGILGLAQVLQRGEMSEKQRKWVNNIESSGMRLLELVNQLLDLISLKAGRMSLNVAPCSLSEICKIGLGKVEASASQKNLTASFSSIPETIVLKADEKILQRMLQNLLSNAIKFTPPGGRFGIDLAGSQSEQRVYISIWDTGIGIQPEDMPRLFQPFVQLDGSLARQYEGSGLGLAIVGLMAELQGGSVEVQSVPSDGSRFTIILPWER